MSHPAYSEPGNPWHPTPGWQDGDIGYVGRSSETTGPQGGEYLVRLPPEVNKEHADTLDFRPVRGTLSEVCINDEVVAHTLQHLFHTRRVCLSLPLQRLTFYQKERHHDSPFCHQRDTSNNAVSRFTGCVSAAVCSQYLPAGGTTCRGSIS